MILHVASLDKFIPPFIKLVREEFECTEHRFWLAGSLEAYPVTCHKGVHVCGEGFYGNIKACLKLLRQLHVARKVILHGLFDLRVMLLLALCPWLLVKCYWVIWGGDLYLCKSSNRSWRSRVKKPLLRFIIPRIGHLVTYIEDDVKLARQWYGAKGIHHECLMYLSNVVDPSLIDEPLAKPQDGTINILVGNSADPSNNHLEALELLLPYKNEDIKIYVPLSYGDQAHAERVIEKGKAWFGEKLVAVTDFMPGDKYLEFLKSIDIAVFNHRRQQAMGNTISLLGMGKTVFMRSDVSQWGYLKSLKITLSNVENISLTKIDDNDRISNVEIIKSLFTINNLSRQLDRIFRS